MSKSHNHTYSPSLSTGTYFIKYIGKTQYIGLDTTYIKVKQYSTDNTPSSTFIILFPPIYDTSTLKVGEIVELHSEDFFWNKNGYYIPTLKFKECKSYPIKDSHQQTVNVDTIQSHTNDINANLSIICSLIMHKRNHWQVENGLHRMLDVEFREDDSKKKMNSAINYSIITKMVTAVLKRNEKKIPIGRKRLMAGWDENFMEKLILETINFLNIGD